MKTTGRNANPKPMPLLKTAIATVAAWTCVGITALVFTTCTAIPVDYSAYPTVHVIPTGQFAASVATPGAGWSLDNVDLGAYNNVGYAVVSDATGTDAIAGDSFAGYTSDAFLRTGLPTLSGGTLAPIVRLETKNLFPNGDMEGGAISFASNGGTVTQTNVAATLPYFNMTGQRLEVNDDGSQSFYFNLNSFSGVSMGNSYALGFKYKLTDPSNGINNPNFFSTDNITNKYQTTLGQPLNNGIPYYSKNSGTLYRFPFTIPPDSAVISSSLISTETINLQYLWFNTTNNNNLSGKATQGDFDDFQLVRSDLQNALRIDIPWFAAGRPNLQTGGHYTVKLWVRQDNTSNYSGVLPIIPPQIANRFAADFIAISLHSPMGNTTSVGNVPNSMIVYSIGSASDWVSAAAANGWTNLSSIANWTQISVSFSGPQTQLASLQLAISTTNMASASLRSPGSILIANPQIFWSPN